MVFSNITFPEDSYCQLLTQLIGETEYLQNNPPDFQPKEDRAGQHVLSYLDKYKEENGGPLRIQHVSFVEGRGNIIIEYLKTKSSRVMSFVGCHLDVVSANPETWKVDPFHVTRDGDKLYGRGTTDCLGHVALVTCLFAEMARANIQLNFRLIGVLISNEENSSDLGIGVDELVKQGYMNDLKKGPLYWVDTADSQPCLGTGGVLAWELKGYGKLFHSGLPHCSINPLELLMESLSILQQQFYKDYGPLPQEVEYNFATPSTMKPTQWKYPGQSINQIPGEASILGDIRLTPFYNCKDVMANLQKQIENINNNIDKLPSRGPCSKYSLPKENLQGRIELKFHDHFQNGVAVDLKSIGYKNMLESFAEVKKDVKPFSITGALPCIRELQNEGYDVQCMGFGNMATYHANNEYCEVSQMKDGFNILVQLVQRFDTQS